MKALITATAFFVALPVVAAQSAPAPTTPIEHVIVLVGENRTFDNLFATYRPKAGQSVWNLLSQGIVRADGSPGRHFDKARQKTAESLGAYQAMPKITGDYVNLPQPWAAGAFGQRKDRPDSRFPAKLPNGPFPITNYVSYGAHTGDPIHRFFQMWQQVDGGANDLFVWTAQTVGIGPSNGALPIKPGQTFQGGVAMGFYNMAKGDAPFFKKLADRYAIADNYHQPIMGGTTVNYLALATGDVAYYTQDGKPANPHEKLIENPNAQSGTNNWYTEDGYGGGTYFNCADAAAPGVAGIRATLDKLPYRAFNNGNCSPDTYYMVNNTDPAFTPTGKLIPEPAGRLLLPPQVIPHIGDLLSKNNVSWKWYSGGRNDGENVDKEYCAMCDTPSFFASTMTGPDKAKLADLQQFYSDVKDAATFPAVTFVAPYDSISGHPGYAMETGFDELAADIVKQVQSNPELWKHTAIFITFDEGGGYYDSGYIQLIDFFGDGTRIPLIAVSPYAKQGHVDHTYYDHASILKFIERNWALPPLSNRSRDSLPNPVHDKNRPYVPTNAPAIGDLIGLFDFGRAASPR
ncbi:MAG TPA: alkaline phosphatase family protein [Rhodocyclaceae bacterium]|nr:alkaline phosphatase family protein [Rhodocyclaceae bacterium]